MSNNISELIIENCNNLVELVDIISTGNKYIVIGVNKYKEKNYGFIKTFKNTTKYTGFEKGGIAVDKTQISNIIEVFKSIVNKHPLLEYEEITVIPKDYSAIQITWGVWNDEEYVKIAKIYDYKNYKGYTKGPRLPLSDIGQAIEDLSTVINILNREYNNPNISDHSSIKSTIIEDSIGDDFTKLL